MRKEVIRPAGGAATEAGPHYRIEFEISLTPSARMLDRAVDVREDRGIMLRVVGVLRRRRRDDAGLVRVCADGDLADGEIRRIEGLPAVLCRSGGALYALGLRCPHAGALLAKGKILDDCLECPLHGGRFALDGGAVRSGPPRHGVPVYDVVVRDGLVYVSRRPRKIPRRSWGARRLSEHRRTGAAQPAAASRWRAR